MAERAIELRLWMPGWNINWTPKSSWVYYASPITSTFHFNSLPWGSVRRTFWSKQWNIFLNKSIVIISGIGTSRCATYSFSRPHFTCPTQSTALETHLRRANNQMPDLGIPGYKILHNLKLIALIDSSLFANSLETLNSIIIEVKLPVINIYSSAHFGSQNCCAVN